MSGSPNPSSSSASQVTRVPPSSISVSQSLSMPSHLLGTGIDGRVGVVAIRAVGHHVADVSIAGGDDDPGERVSKAVAVEVFIDRVLRGLVDQQVAVVVDAIAQLNRSGMNRVDRSRRSPYRRTRTPD